MSAFATVALTNEAAATVNFTPLNLDNTGVARWGTANSVYDAKSLLSMKVDLPSGKSTRIKVKQKLTIPVMDAVDATLKIDELICNVEFSLPKSATQTQRLDMRKYAATLLAHAITTAAVDVFEGIY